MTTLEIKSAQTFPGAHILIVDDERALRHTLAGVFKHLGYQVTEAGSGREALEHIKNQKRFKLRKDRILAAIKVLIMTVSKGHGFVENWLNWLWKI